MGTNNFLFSIILSFIFSSLIFAETVIRTSSKDFFLDTEIETIAKKINPELSKSKYLDRKFLRNTKFVRNYNIEDGGELFTVVTDDGFELKGTFFNRNSDKLIIIGTGFCDPRERKSVFIDMFPLDDVVFFDKRAEGCDHTIDFSFCDAGSWRSTLAVKLLNVNTEFETFGIREHEDIIKVVDHFADQKKYNQVVGLGLCYSAVLFTKVAFERPNLFTKLILDGCWLSIDNLIDKYLKHGRRMLPFLQTPEYLNWALLDREWFKYFAAHMVAKKIFGLQFDQSHLSILDHLPSVNIPILFMHGSQDIFTTSEEFEIIWESVKSENKVAWVTQNAHARNHLLQPELYKLICELFINHSIQDFSFYLQNPSVLEGILSIKYLNRNICS